MESIISRAWRFLPYQSSVPFPKLAAALCNTRCVSNAHTFEWGKFHRWQGFLPLQKMDWLAARPRHEELPQASLDWARVGKKVVSHVFFHVFLPYGPGLALMICGTRMCLRGGGAAGKVECGESIKIHIFRQFHFHENRAFCAARQLLPCP
nr:hypothetical protein [uncultured Ottowia sp.]